MGAKRGAVDFALAYYSGVSDELNKYKISPTKPGWWVTYNKGLKVFDNHQKMTTLRSASPRLTDAIASLISSST